MKRNQPVSSDAFPERPSRQETSPVSEDTYKTLYDFVRRMQGSTDACDASFQDLDRLTRFLNLEARLLDERDYQEWLEHFTDDCVYWVPGGSQLADPRTEVAVNFDDRRRLLDRIAVQETGVQVAQIPPSRTCRTVTNIEAWREDDGGFRLRSNLVAWEYRRQQTSSYAGCQYHLLVRSGDRLRIRFKIICLVNQADPQGNITFIL